MSRPRAFENFPEELEASYGPYAAVCDKVYDGDTLSLRFSVGLGSYPFESVRLKTKDGEWVGAPELSEPGGEETRDYCAHLLPYEAPCLVVTEKTSKSRVEKKSLTRYVGIVTLEGGRDLGMLIDGFVKERGYGRGKGG